MSFVVNEWDILCMFSVQINVHISVTLADVFLFTYSFYHFIGQSLGDPLAVCVENSMMGGGGVGTSGNSGGESSLPACIRGDKVV